MGRKTVELTLYDDEVEEYERLIDNFQENLDSEVRSVVDATISYRKSILIRLGIAIFCFTMGLILAGNFT